MADPLATPAHMLLSGGLAVVDGICWSAGGDPLTGRWPASPGGSPVGAAQPPGPAMGGHA